MAIKGCKTHWFDCQSRRSEAQLGCYQRGVKDQFDIPSLSQGCQNQVSKVDGSFLTPRRNETVLLCLARRFSVFLPSFPKQIHC